MYRKNKEWRTVGFGVKHLSEMETGLKDALKEDEDIVDVKIISKNDKYQIVAFIAKVK